MRPPASNTNFVISEGGLLRATGELARSRRAKDPVFYKTAGKANFSGKLPGRRGSSNERNKLHVRRKCPFGSSFSCRLPSMWAHLRWNFFGKVSPSCWRHTWQSRPARLQDTTSAQAQCCACRGKGPEQHRLRGPCPRTH